MDCKEAKVLIHDFLDGSLESDGSAELKLHMEQCPSCAEHLQELEKTEALVRLLQPVESPDGMKEQIMQMFPAKKRHDWKSWIRRHPAVTAAVLLIVIMGSSLMMLWGQDSTLTLKGDDLDHLIVQGNHVIVPEGVTINGDLTVENGTLDVRGEIKGNLTIVDGTLQQASTANISGKVTRVNQMIDWFWYKIGEWFNG